MRDFGTWPYYSKACREDVNELLKQGDSLSAYRANKDFGSGPRKGSWAWRLEREIEKRFGIRHAVAVNSGTAALHAALATLGLSSDSEVVTSPYTFSATAAAIVLAGARPVFADVCPETYCITKETVKHVLTKKTKAVLPVHLFGYLGDVGQLQGLGFPVIEDACQAVGAQRGGAFSGTVGIAGAYSFNGGKNCPAGEGGALVTNSDEVAEKARLRINHAENYGTPWVGYNYRMPELTACVAWHGLQELKERNRRRIGLAELLTTALVRDETLGDCLSNGFFSPGRPFNDSHVYYVWPFTLRSSANRGVFIKRMKRMGVSVGGGYITPPLHHYPAFRKYAKGPLPVVDELSFKTLCLLDCVRPPATDADMRYVAQCMKRALR